MKIFYIDKVEDNLCYLVSLSKLYKETVSIESLSEFSKVNTVVGYNRSTGKVEVKAEESIIEHINVKRKLVGLPILVNTTDLCTITVVPNKINTVRIMNDTGYELLCLTERVQINWEAILRALLTSDSVKTRAWSTIDILDLILELDIDPVYEIYTNQVTPTFDQRRTDLIVNTKIKSNRTDLFKIANSVGKIFRPSNYKCNKALVSHSLTQVDLSNCVFSPECTVIGFLGEVTHDYDKVLKDIKMHESFYHTKQVSLGEFCGDRHNNYKPLEELLNFLREVAKTFKNDIEFTVSDCSLLSYSCIVELYEYNPKIIMDAVCIGELVLDCMITATPESVKPFGENKSRIDTGRIRITDSFDLDLDFDIIDTLMPLIDESMPIVKDCCGMLVSKEMLITGKFVVELAEGNVSNLEKYRKAQEILRDSNSEFYQYVECFKGITANKLRIVTDTNNFVKAKFLAFMLILNKADRHITIECKDRK